MSWKNIFKGKPFLPQFLCSLVLCFTMFVFAPIDMYIMNSSNFWFTLKEFVPMFLVVFVGAFAVTQLLFLALRLLPRAMYLLMLAVLAGVTTGLYLQGNFLCMANEVMGGGEPVWNEMLTSAGINMLIWVAVILVFIGMMVIKPRFFTKFVSFISAMILVMEGTSLTVSLINQAEVDTSSNYIYYGDIDRFTCSQNGDVLVFLVDTLDTRLFDQMREENPEYLTELEGFTYYRNASSSYRKTAPSVVSILTGYLCMNQNPFFTDVNNAFTQGTFLPTMQQNGMTVGIYGGPSGIFNSETMKQVDNLVLNEPEVGNKIVFIKNMMEMIGYRYAPLVLQPYVYGDYRTVFNECKSVPDGGPASTSSQNSSVIKAFRKQGISVDNTRRFFKFWKMQGAHTPFNTDRTGAKVKSGSVDIYEQSLGSFAILNEILVDLKKNDVYDNSTIIIMADHGEGWICNPTFLVKYPDSEIEGLAVSNAPVELLDMRATALYGAGLPYEQEGTPVHMWEGVENRERLYYAYNWAKPEGLDFYLDDLKEFAVPADATDTKGYKPTGNVY